MERLTRRDPDGSIAVHGDDVASAFYNCIDRLIVYEDEEEQGRLIRLPCPMNTKIYLIVTKRARSYSTKQFRFIKTSQLTWCNLETVLRNFGKTVFLDRNEAEEAMERMNKEDEDGRNH